jgi:tetratricopeptide (TPR) repeat protein
MSTTEGRPDQPPAHERRLVSFGRLLLALGLLGGVGAGWALIGRTPAVVERARLIEARAHEKYRHKLGERIAAQCRKSHCSCAVSAASAGLDLDVANDVLPLVDSAIQECPDEAALSGFKAEALVRLSRPEGRGAANEVLAREPNNANAHYALALAGLRAGKPVNALDELRAAANAGRGAEAHLLAGLILYNLGRFDDAEPEFTEAARLDEEDPAAVYNLALVHHQKSRFARAREGYLKVLRLNPSHADARFNLAVLAHSLGSLDEARHHLRKFAELKPAEASVKKLEAIVASPVKEAPKMGAAPP